jgi:PKD domain
VRGQAIHQNAFIDKMKIRPRYAELGRLIDPDAIPRFPPTGSFTFSDQTNQVGRFNASGSADLTFIINYEWTFGDGEIGYGEIVEHQYPAPGIYSVTLVVTDNNGNRTSVTQPVTLS